MGGLKNMSRAEQEAYQNIKAKRKLKQKSQNWISLVLLVWPALHVITPGAYRVACTNELGAFIARGTTNDQGSDGEFLAISSMCLTWILIMRFFQNYRSNAAAFQDLVRIMRNFTALTGVKQAR